MSKYGIFEDHLTSEQGGNTAKNYFLYCILNELAEGNVHAKEANRLKKIEITKYCNVNNYDTSFDENNINM